MRIISKNEVRILAIHDDMVFMFCVDCLGGPGSLDKNPDNQENIARTVVGVYIDKNFKMKEVVSAGKYHGMIMKATESMAITKVRYTELLKSEAALAKLKNAGVDFEGYGVTL